MSHWKFDATSGLSKMSILTRHYWKSMRAISLVRVKTSSLTGFLAVTKCNNILSMWVFKRLADVKVKGKPDRHQGVKAEQKTVCFGFNGCQKHFTTNFSISHSLSLSFHLHLSEQPHSLSYFLESDFLQGYFFRGWDQSTDLDLLLIFHSVEKPNPHTIAHFINNSPANKKRSNKDGLIQHLTNYYYSNWPSSTGEFSLNWLASRGLVR